MTPRERFLTVLNGGKPDDRMPMVEWAAWWDKTIDRWKQEGMPSDLNWEQSLQYFCLDELHNIGAKPDVPPAPSHGAAVIATEADYNRIWNDLYSDKPIDNMVAGLKRVRSRHENGEISIRIWLDGFFWYPRRLFGIEPHLYAFYDYPELMHKMTSDLCDFNMKALEAVFAVLKPEFIGYGEDMSYNHGPMLSHELFKEFIQPHYKKLIAYTRENKVRSLMDSDGDITVMVPWLIDAGLDGVYPLERQAGVDINYIRKQYPEFIMLGGYNKMVMSQGEAAMRAEFERILPVMRSSRYIPSVDHQTPPGVSLENFKIYMGLFEEYCKKAVA